jgi:glutamate-5-semialdehyde dehydrogenase
MDIATQMLEMARKAKAAAAVLASCDGAAKKKALLNIAALLEAEKAAIQAANAADVEAAKATEPDSPRIKRLTLSDAVMASMIQGCREVAAQDDPVGGIENLVRRPNGMLVGRMRVPLGVVAMIYESRPNVTIDASILCLLAGNAVILRGGSEAIRSNQALASVIARGLTDAGLPGDAVQVVPTTDREAVNALLSLDEYIDVVIPRGGEGLIRAVCQKATMPVLKHYKGVCHIYVHADADLPRAVDICLNAKTQYPAACNALECLLVHKDVAAEFLPRMAERLAGHGVRFRGCARCLPLLRTSAGLDAQAATDADWGFEFLDLILAVKVVDSQTEATAHIARYGSNHTEAILTADYARSLRFLREVDASLVVVNGSTRFNDGISTSKLHAYGPMGVTELTTTKFVLLGEGHIRV